jgi:hypothetical protein
MFLCKSGLPDMMMYVKYKEQHIYQLLKNHNSVSYLIFRDLFFITIVTFRSVSLRCLCTNFKVLHQSFPEGTEKMDENPQ